MNKFVFGVIFVGLVLCGTNSAVANNLSAAQLAYFEKEAKLDDKIAFELAHVYLNGSQGVTKNPEKAVNLFKKLADNYSEDGIKVKSAYILGVLYMGQQEHVVDHQQAEHYFKIAAEGATKDSLTDAPYHFAMLTKNDKAYIEFLEKSALLGYVPAMVQLVTAYSEKKRVKTNDNALVKWLRMAADEDHIEAQNLLGNMYFSGDIVYQDYERAYYYLIRAAEHRNPEAQSKLGLIYKLGLGTKVDLVKAQKWFELSYKTGNVIAGENLAGLLLSSEKQEEVKRGLSILESVAKLGSKSAAQKVVSIYQEGKLVKKNAEQLAFWQQQYQNNKDDHSEVIGLNKIEQGEEKVYKASSKAVSFHAKGWQFLKDKDYDKAIPLLKQAALLDLPVAQLDLAIALIQQAQYLEDEALYLKAFAWVKIAANNQQERAGELLSEMQNAFDTRMLQKALSQYRDIKGRIAK